MRRIPASQEERCFGDQYKMAREGEGRRAVGVGLGRGGRGAGGKGGGGRGGGLTYVYE